MIEKPPATLDWRLRVRMAENKINTATELKRRLDAVGYQITSAQLSRILDERPAQIKTALLEARLQILGGTLDELMPLRTAPPQAQAPNAEAPPAVAPTPKKTRPRKRPDPVVASQEDLTGGPKVSPFPLAKRPTEAAR